MGSKSEKQREKGERSRRDGGKDLKEEITEEEGKSGKRKGKIGNERKRK